MVELDGRDDIGCGGTETGGCGSLGPSAVQVARAARPAPGPPADSRGPAPSPLAVGQRPVHGCLSFLPAPLPPEAVWGFLVC